MRGSRLNPFCLKSSSSWLLFKQTSPQLFIKLQTIRSEIADQQEAHIRERQELEQAQEDLTRELKLKWVEPLPTSLWCLLRNRSWLLSPSQMRARVRLLALRPSRPQNLALNIWSDSNSSERRRVAESERELPRAYESHLERTRVIWSPWESSWAPEGLRPNDRERAWTCLDLVQQKYEQIQTLRESAKVHKVLKQQEWEFELSSAFVFVWSGFRSGKSDADDFGPSQQIIQPIWT